MVLGNSNRKVNTKLFEVNQFNRSERGMYCTVYESHHIFIDMSKGKGKKVKLSL
jgi:hypothetical protein